MIQTHWLIIITLKFEKSKQFECWKSEYLALESVAADLSKSGGRWFLAMLQTISEVKVCEMRSLAGRNRAGPAGGADAHCAVASLFGGHVSFFVGFRESVLSNIAGNGRWPYNF